MMVKRYATEQDIFTQVCSRPHMVASIQAKTPDNQWLEPWKMGWMKEIFVFFISKKVHDQFPTSVVFWLPTQTHRENFTPPNFNKRMVGRASCYSWGVYLLRNIDGEDVVTSVVWWFVGLRQERKDPSDFYQIGSRWCFQTCFVFTPLGKDGFGFGESTGFLFAQNSQN